ncbi:MAG: tetratricopeptide repeat protein [Patescibacteria group bacterium]
MTNKNKKTFFKKKTEKKSPPRRDPGRKSRRIPFVRDAVWKLPSALPAGQFPKNNRSITENFIFKVIHKHRRLLLISFASLLIFLAIVTVSIDAYVNYQENKRFTQERIKIESEIKLWQSAAERFPNYRDAYFQLAVLNYRLRKYDNAREYLKKALKLDPNFKEGRELEQKLNH